MLPNVVLFAGKDSTSTASLWVTDGTASGTFELLTNPPADVTKPPITGEAIFGFVPQASMPLYLTVFDDQVLFWGRYSPNPAAPVSKGPYTLWTTDGTATGTVPIPLTSITGANPNGLFIGNDNSGDVTPGFTVFGDEVLFRGIDTAGASGLWMTNGTAAGTMEITAGTASGGINPTDITIFNGAALFNGVNAAGKLGLWTTDGTAEGTKEVTSTGGSAGLNPTNMTVLNNEVLFNGVDSSGLSGLWVTNGIAAGTRELVAGLDPTDLTLFGDEVLFNGIDANGLSGLWMTDGTTNGTHELLAAAAVPVGAGDPHGLNPTDMTVFGNEVLFNGLDSAGRQFLWVTNGAPGGTHEIPVTTGFPPSAGLKPSNLEVYNGQVLFSGLDSTGHQDLWTTDGTGTGTHEITPVSGVWAVGLFPTGLTALTAGEAVPPTIGGTVSGQTTTSEAPVHPFAHVTIGDANAGATDTLTITVGGAGGMLTDGTGFSSLMTVGAGVYRLSGAAASITSELAALVFTPTAGAPNTTSTTTFTLSDQSSAGGAPILDSTTSVIDSDPAVAPPPPTGAHDILFQNVSGQVAGWAVDGASLTGSALLGANPGPNWKSVGGGDFNGDSEPDILLRNTNGNVAVWETDGTDVTTTAAVANPGANWKAIGTGDFNDDHHSDILLQNTNGSVAIWEMGGTNGTKVTSSAVVTNPGANWKAIATGDFNGDHHSDIVLQNTNGSVAIWEMDETNGTSVMSSAVVANPGANWKVIGTGDFNGDHHSDILLQNTNGNVAIWEMGGTNGTSVMSSAVVANPGPSWRAIGTDGGADILLQNTSGQTAIWDMSGTSVTASGTVSANAGPNWHAIGMS
jgi:FG-GAP-like repeat